MKSEILFEIPISGSIKEVNFDARGECLWVKFDTGDDSWVGVFGRGSVTPQSNGVARVGKTSTVFVLAGGQGYLVDTQTRTCKGESQSDHLQCVRSIPDREIVIACDFSRVYLFDLGDQVWASDVLSDGIVFQRVTSSHADGAFWDPAGQWIAFVLDLNNYAIEIGSVISFEYDHFTV